MDNSFDLFIGEYRHSIDAKGRLTIPRRFRELLGEEAVVTAGFDGSLECYRVKDFRDHASCLLELPYESPEARRRLRRAFAMACHGGFDRLGRLLLPRKLLEYADLSVESLIIGLGNRMEIWNPERYGTWAKNL